MEQNLQYWPKFPWMLQNECCIQCQTLQTFGKVQSLKSPMGSLETHNVTVFKIYNTLVYIVLILLLILLLQQLLDLHHVKRKNFLSIEDIAVTISPKNRRLINYCKFVWEDSVVSSFFFWLRFHNCKKGYTMSIKK